MTKTQILILASFFFPLLLQNDNWCHSKQWTKNSYTLSNVRSWIVEFLKLGEGRKEGCSLHHWHIHHVINLTTFGSRAWGEGGTVFSPLFIRPVINSCWEVLSLCDKNGAVHCQFWEEKLLPASSSACCTICISMMSRCAVPAAVFIQKNNGDHNPCGD